ncbi:unnamed protein product [Blepharisma stoltei]|uniref:Uncharacterized protein n=1 Tax=Blepharisma stoltei TaxID=1481888 RepID=A0AAU9JY35_9CILI|nr:unnamed protein product [Blepharisma stoltei]
MEINQKEQKIWMQSKAKNPINGGQQKRSVVVIGFQKKINQNLKRFCMSCERCTSHKMEYIGEKKGEYHYS